MISHKRHNFIERSIRGVIFFLKESLYSDEYARKRGFLQARHPVIKVISLGLVLLLVIFTRSIGFLFVLYAFILLLAVSSNIELGFFIKRAWFFIPLFSLFIVVPNLFSAFTPGQPLWGFTIIGRNFVITRQGASSALIFILRVAASVSLTVLIGLTTQHTRFLKALRLVRIPQLFVMVLGMTYRYIYLFLSIIEDTYTAIKSRVGFVNSVKSGREIVAWNIASLWQRSVHFQQQVYNAMVSRGYSGEPVVLQDYCPTVKDWCFFTATLLLSLVFLWIT